MPMSGNRNHIAHVELLAVSRVKRAYSRIDVIAELSQFLDVVQHLPTDVFLIGLRQPLHLRHRLF
jgi:hypothetical protein